MRPPVDRRRRAFAIAGLSAIAGAGRLAAREEAPREEAPGMRFSALREGERLPAWLVPVTFRGKAPTMFTLVNDGGRTVLRAQARAAASGMAREIRADPVRYPRLAWRWKVTALAEKGDLDTKEGDDFAARLYLRFGRPLRPDLALCYVWAAHAPVGTSRPNPWSDRVQMVVADSGAAQLGRWVAHERDYAEDFRRAFGATVPEVTALIVSADTDNTGGNAEAFFGDIALR